LKPEAEVVGQPIDNLSPWQDYLENMRRIGADETSWLQHIETMRQVRANVVGREMIRAVQGSVETIIEGCGSGPIICFIHSVLGISTEVLDLADMLGPDYRLLSIRPSSKNRNGRFASSIEKMAETYVEALVEAQPEGDFVICGRSAGVVIGLHMSTLLIERGRRIKLFVALDFAPYNTGADVGPFNLLRNYQILRNWVRQAQDNFRNRSSYRAAFHNIWKTANEKFIASRPKTDKDKHPIVSPTDLFKYLPHELEFVDECDRAMRRYKYELSHSMPIIMFLSTKEPDRSEYNVVAKWQKIVNKTNLTVITVPGTTHRNIAEKPFVITVANCLRSKLENMTVSIFAASTVGALANI
jgi:hypothetical protein